MRSKLLAIAQVLAFSLSTSDCSAEERNALNLSSELIANRALIVANATKTTGSCYAAVSRALLPLGVKLTGASAYMAEPLLLQDPRFIPLSISSIEQLRRGDIIVYSASASHPHGHISVYEGDYLEASDHVSKVTHTKAYGGATVFRLRGEQLVADPVIAIAPDFRSTSRKHNSTPLNSAKEIQPIPFQQGPTNDSSAGLWKKLKRTYNGIAKSSGTGALPRRLVRYLFRSI